MAGGGGGRRVRHEVRDAGRRPLVGGEGPQPPRAEAGDVVQEGCGGGEDLPVAGPARALALGTVGGDVARVVPEAPNGRLVQAVDAFVAAAKPPGSAQVGVDDDAAHVLGGEWAGVALDPDVLEAVRGVTGLERSPSSPLATTSSTGRGQRLSGDEATASVLMPRRVRAMRCLG